MKTYRVWAKIISYAYLDVDAEDEDEAWEVADRTDGGEFTPTHDGDWELLDTDYITEV